MLDVGPTSGMDPTSDLLAFVDGLAKVDDPATRDACAEIRRRAESGELPVGLRRIGEGLAGQPGEQPGATGPDGDTSDVAEAIRTHPLVVVGTDQPAAGAASALVALLKDSRRVVVTAEDPAALAEVRAELPPEVARLCMTSAPPLGAVEMRQLHALLATATPQRRSRAGQILPRVDVLPSPEQVAELCHIAVRGNTDRSEHDLIPQLLAELDPQRRDAVVKVARSVERNLAGLDVSTETPWVWPLMSDLVVSRFRAEFAQLVADCGQAIAAVHQAGVGGGDATSRGVGISGELPADATGRLRGYLAYVEAGGRLRSYFRTPEQREADVVLAHLRVAGGPVDSADKIRAALAHVESVDRLHRITAGCRELGIPAPENIPQLAEFTDRLHQVSAAIRAVDVLRHDVLFIHPHSPIAVPDLLTAQSVARAITSYGGISNAIEAARQLDAMAGQVAELVPPAGTAPEHLAAVDAIRTWDPQAYAAALDGLAQARREDQDQTRCTALLGQLRAAAPELAAEWERTGGRPGALGSAYLVTVADMLSALPPVDSTDVVLVLGAADLGIERLLIAAAAPRIVAVETPQPPRDELSTVLDVLIRASAVVISWYHESAAERPVTRLRPSAPTMPTVPTQRPGPRTGAPRAGA